MTRKALAFITLFIVSIATSYSQEDIDLILTQKYAENSLRDGDYEFALENFLKLYNVDKNNIDLNYKIGICYTETTIDKAKAIPYLEFVVGHNNYPIRSFYYLGRAYMYNYRFTEAVEAFYEYKMMGISEDIINQTDRLIQMCYNALEFINVPKNVTFELLDTAVNSKFNDYLPMVSADGNMLVYTTNRTYVAEYENYIANLFFSDKKKGIFQPGQRLPVSTFDTEESVGMTPTGEKILVYANGDYFTHDIKMVNRKGGKFTNAAKNELPTDMNTPGIEMGACLSPDGNTLYYTSDRRGGFGGLDIYTSKKDINGVWSPSVNMGSTVNTEYDENYPSWSPDGKTFYFASRGHDGIGEYDIFKTSYIDSLQSWIPPRNLGFPINTPLDNTTISFVTDGKTAYLAANRKEGIGKLDIYKLTFGDENQVVNIIGTVMVGTEANSVPYSEDFLKAYATLFDSFGNIISQLEVLSEGGLFFGALFPGTYRLEVKFDGKTEGYNETLKITPEDKEVYRTIYLKQ
jgi:tetratricopeptide (TPR) repeat protein